MLCSLQYLWINNLLVKTLYLCLASSQGRSKVIRGIIAWKEGEPGNEATYACDLDAVL